MPLNNLLHGPLQDVEVPKVREVSLVLSNKAFFLQWQVWRDHGPNSHSQSAKHIVIAWSIATYFVCLDQEPTYVVLDWLVAWGVMSLTKFVIFLYWWSVVVVLLSFNNFSLSLELWQEQPQASLVFILRYLGKWYSYSIIIVWRGRGNSILFHKKEHNIKYIVSPIPNPDGTVHRSFFHMSVCISPISISNWCEEVLRNLIMR